MKRTLLALALLVAVPFAASAAEGVSYSYVEGGYTRVDAKNTGNSNDADGWALNGSGAIAPNFHVFGGYSKVDISNTNIGIDQWRLGVGYNKELNPKVDLVTKVAYEKFDAGAGVNGDGYSVEAGVRSALTPMIEGYAMAGYEDYRDFNGDFYGRVGAQVKFSPSWGLAGDVKFANGDTQLFVGPRISF